MSIKSVKFVFIIMALQTWIIKSKHQNTERRWNLNHLFAQAATLCLVTRAAMYPGIWRRMLLNAWSLIGPLPEYRVLIGWLTHLSWFQQLALALTREWEWFGLIHPSSAQWADTNVNMERNNISSGICAASTSCKVFTIFTTIKTLTV